MTLTEARTVISAVEEQIRDNYKIEWLAHTLNYIKDKNNCYELDIYLSYNGGIKSGAFVLYDNADSYAVKQAFELAVLKVLREADNDSKRVLNAGV